MPIAIGPRMLPTIAIASRAGHAFTPSTMVAGFACHARGVELAATGPNRVHARVKAKVVHDVLLRAVEGRLVIACSCPHRGARFCEHSWAALLEVDRTQGLSDLRHGQAPLVVETGQPVSKATSARAERPSLKPARKAGAQRQKHGGKPKRA